MIFLFTGAPIPLHFARKVEIHIEDCGKMNDYAIWLPSEDDK